MLLIELPSNLPQQLECRPLRVALLNEDCEVLTSGDVSHHVRIIKSGCGWAQHAPMYINFVSACIKQELSSSALGTLALCCDSTLSLFRTFWLTAKYCAHQRQSSGNAETATRET